MSEQDNIKIAQATFDALNAHNLDKWSQLQASNSQSEAPGAAGPMSLDDTRKYVQGFLTAFPDLKFEVTRSIARGDDVVMHWASSGTHTGPMRTPSGNSIPPTNKKSKVSGSTTFEIKNGKVTRSWIFWDMATLLNQLGLLPPM